MAAAIYSTVNETGIDINAVFALSTATPEYPRPPFITGQLAWGTDGSEWVYCTSSITLGAGAVVVVSAVPGSWSVALIGGSAAAAPLGALVGIIGGSNGSLVVPAPSGSVTGNFFWVQRAGNAPNVKTSAATTINAQLYTIAATAGQLFSTTPGTGSGSQVAGIVISQATGSAAGPNTAILNYPTVGIAT